MSRRDPNAWRIGLAETWEGMGAVLEVAHEGATHRRLELCPGDRVQLTVAYDKQNGPLVYVHGLAAAGFDLTPKDSG